MAEKPLHYKVQRPGKTTRNPDGTTGLHILHGQHPDKGFVSRLEYYPRPSGTDPQMLAIQHLSVPREQRGNGYASQAMDELQRRYPGVPIDHGERTDDGHDWWDAYSAGKEITNGRTMAAKTSAYSFEYAHNTEKSPHAGGMFGQDIEPHGRYLTVKDPHGNYDDRWEFGEHSFTNPKHMDFGGSYSEPDNWKRRLSEEYGGKTGKPLSRALLKDGHDGIVTHDEDGPREIVDLTPLRKKTAVVVEHNHQYDDPSTWSDEYRDWVKKSPHGAAVSVAQQAARRDAPTMDMDLGERDDATSAVQHMMRRGGHPDADDAFVMKHPKPGREQSQAFFSDGEPGIALHPHRWDYGTAAHEVAHHLHMNEMGRKPHDDAEAHGLDFVKHYQNVLGNFGPDAAKTLGDTYHEALGHLRHEGAFTPTKRLFGPTQGLDVRLFDGAHLKPDVRAYIMGTLDAFWKPLYGPSWTHWSRVYFAGSEASEWTSESLEGNNDFDVLVGVHYSRARLHVPEFTALSDEEITDLLNKQFKVLDERTAAAYIPVQGEVYGPFSNTWYVNANSWDIRTIKPYAAYNVSDDSWAVAPPHLPEWSVKDFPEGPALVEEARAVSAYVKAVLKLPEPYRSQQGFALWQHLHSDRARAFGPNGEGWYDPGNVLEKWLDQSGLWDKLVEIMVDVKAHPDKLLAPAGWSNMPGGMA